MTSTDITPNAVVPGAVKVLNADDAARILHGLGIPTTPLAVAFVRGILTNNRVILVQLPSANYAKVVAGQERLVIVPK